MKPANTVADFEQRQQEQIFITKSSPLWFKEPATRFEEEETVENNVRLGFSLCGSQTAGVFVRKIFCENVEQLKVGDKITQVNGKSSAGYGPDQLARMIRYALSTDDPIIVTISRPSKRPHLMPTINNHFVASSVSEGQDLYHRSHRYSSKVGKIFDMPETSIGIPSTKKTTTGKKVGNTGNEKHFCPFFKRQMTASVKKSCGKFSPHIFHKRSISYSPLKYSKFVMKEDCCSNNGFSNTAYNVEPNPDLVIENRREESPGKRPNLLHTKVQWTKPNCG